MSDKGLRPNWASPPGETIRSILHSTGLSIGAFREEIGLPEKHVADLLAGVSPVTPSIAKNLAKAVGSTPTFWLERQKQYQASLKELAAAEPDLTNWVTAFPIKKMVESGWLEKSQTKDDIPYELLDYFDVASVDEWREKYQARLGIVKFRTSEAFNNDAATTIAWIRHGEIIADTIPCGRWNRDRFSESLEGLKALTRAEDPKVFIPALRTECAKHGVAVVVNRCIAGCAASGATLMLDPNKALLLLSARFLSDDQFWFSFFHEAGHLVLHSREPHIESASNSASQEEVEANNFAEHVLLGPGGEETLLTMPLNKFSIARFARQCKVAPGIIVGQLQHRGRLSPKLFNTFKTRYTSASFNL